MILPTCKHCGQTLPRALEFAGVHLTPMQKRIVERVHRAGKHGATLEMLVNACYADDADGGPLHAERSVHVQVCFANKRLAPVGVQVRSDKKGGRGAFYRLMPL